jgi:hypothetical protein
MLEAAGLLKRIHPPGAKDDETARDLDGLMGTELWSNDIGVFFSCFCCFTRTSHTDNLIDSASHRSHA